MALNGYRDLEVWKASMDLALNIYEITKKFPKHEIYGLGSQMQRAAVSVPANISEGCGRYSTKEFIRFLDIANGSLVELETYILLAEQLSYIKNEESLILLDQSSRIGRMVLSLRRSLIKKAGGS